MITASKSFINGPATDPRPRLISAVNMVLFTLLLAPLFNTANADYHTERGGSAATIPHPELEPRGLRRGGFIIMPQIFYWLRYNDNVFATENNTESSFVSELIPQISANSDWSNHALNFSFDALVSRNHDFSSENYEDWNLALDGIVDISRETRFASGVSLGREHIERSAPDDSRGTEPTAFDQSMLFARYTHSANRLVTVINLELVRKEYDDVDAIRLGVPVRLDNSDRDRTETGLRWRSGYRYLENEQVFFSLEAFDRDYDELRNFSDQDQSSTGLEFLAGASFDFGGILLGEFAVGYRSQDYEEPLEDIETPIVEASLLWNLTDLTSLDFILDHQVRESIDLVFSGYTTNSATLSLDHELRRNLLLNLSLRYAREEFVGIDPATRDDDVYSIAAGATYKVNRNFYLGARYAYLERKSDGNTAFGDSSQFDFAVNLISFRLRAQF